MRRVIVESPYGAPDEETVAANVAYARACLADCFRRGEAPFASHLLYTQEGVLDDRDGAQRAIGIDAGLMWGAVAEATVVYLDRGISPGMRLGIAAAEGHRRPIEYRRLSA